MLSDIILVLAETAETAETGANPIASLLPFLLVGLAFWFLIIRPQRKRQAEQQQMLRQVGVGDEIVTIGGFHGRIVALADDSMEVELSPGVIVTMARNAISKTLSEPAPVDLDDLDDDDFDDETFDDETVEDEYVDDEFGDERLSHGELDDEEPDTGHRHDDRL